MKKNLKSKHDFAWGEYFSHHAISLAEAAEALNYSRSTIIRYIKQKRIHGFKSKGKWFVVLPQI